MRRLALIAFASLPMAAFVGSPARASHVGCDSTCYQKCESAVARGIVYTSVTECVDRRKKLNGHGGLADVKDINGRPMVLKIAHTYKRCMKNGVELQGFDWAAMDRRCREIGLYPK
jgi:hypothetical protein